MTKNQNNEKMYPDIPKNANGNNFYCTKNIPNFTKQKSELLTFI